ncbi:MAG TPA: hypothetical protein VMP67_10590 [Candidatus Limnocylindria bacterium]|nr:hypothetical protein [Candidatus Limnocylindria bacterium]
MTDDVITESMPEQEQVAKATVQAPRVGLRMAAVGMVKADQAEITNGLAGVVIAGKQASLSRGGARTIISAGRTDISQGGAGMVLSAGETRITQGGAGTLLSLGNVRIEQGGAMVMLTRQASVGTRGFVGLAITPRLELGEGARVLLGVEQARALGIATVASALILVVGRLLRRGNSGSAAT